MGKYRRMLGQNKEYAGKLSTRVVEDVIKDFKRQYALRGDEIEGFELDGGFGMVSGAQTKWREFQRFCDERGLKCIYNTEEECDKIRENLINRNNNKNRNRN